MIWGRRGPQVESVSPEPVVDELLALGSLPSEAQLGEWVERYAGSRRVTCQQADEELAQLGVSTQLYEQALQASALEAEAARTLLGGFVVEDFGQEPAVEAPAFGAQEVAELGAGAPQGRPQSEEPSLAVETDPSVVADDPEYSAAAEASEGAEVLASPPRGPTSVPPSRVQAEPDTEIMRSPAPGSPSEASASMSGSGEDAVDTAPEAAERGSNPPSLQPDPGETVSDAVGSSVPATGASPARVAALALEEAVSSVSMAPDLDAAARGSTPLSAASFPSGAGASSAPPTPPRASSSPSAALASDTVASWVPASEATVPPSAGRKDEARLSAEEDALLDQLFDGPGLGDEAQSVREDESAADAFAAAGALKAAWTDDATQRAQAHGHEASFEADSSGSAAVAVDEDDDAPLSADELSLLDQWSAAESQPPKPSTVPPSTRPMRAPSAPAPGKPLSAASVPRSSVPATRSAGPAPRLSVPALSSAPPPLPASAPAPHLSVPARRRAVTTPGVSAPAPAQSAPPPRFAEALPTAQGVISEAEMDMDMDMDVDEEIELEADDLLIEELEEE